MNSQATPGPDGFGGCFFQTYWDIVSLDVFNAVMQFFTQGWILPNYNSNIVYLIPNFPRADHIESY